MRGGVAAAGTGHLEQGRLGGRHGGGVRFRARLCALFRTSIWRETSHAEARSLFHCIIKAMRFFKVNTIFSLFFFYYFLRPPPCPPKINLKYFALKKCDRNYLCKMKQLSANIICQMNQCFKRCFSRKKRCANLK